MGSSIDLKKFSQARILVIGDLMLDRYLWGNVERISPEAPVPVFHIRERSEVLGGAGNVASNLVGLGCSVTAIGLTGNDDAKLQLKNLLLDRGVNSHIIIDPDRPTVTKTRVVSQGQQLIRFDEEETLPIKDNIKNELLESIKDNLANSNAIIVSDYGKGILQAKDLAQDIIRLARSSCIPVIIDPKGNDWERYRGATCITPNTKELEAVLGYSISDEEQLVQAMRSTMSQYGFDWLVVTRGPLGMCIMNKRGSCTFLPALTKQVYDVSGAGDTVIATLSLCVGSGFTFLDGAKLANIAAGIVVGKVGTQPIDLTELISALKSSAGIDCHHHNITNKVMSLSSAVMQVEAWRASRLKIVFTNGCFDLLHPGHLHLLNQARQLGDRLIVAINSDNSVKRLKGSSRPILAEHDRASLLASLSCVDVVLIFESDTPVELLKSLKPHILVKGADYTVEEVAGREIVESYGGEVRILKLLSGYSTTAITTRVFEAYGSHGINSPSR